MRRAGFYALAVFATAPSNLFSLTVFSSLYTFTGGSDGGKPSGGLVANAAGSLFGVTQTGGTAGGGMVFELTPPATAGDPWTFAVLYSFQKNTIDGFAPVGPLVLRPDGSLIGSTTFGGSLDGGTVFQLVPPSVTGGVWTETILYSFDYNLEGNSPGPVTVRPSGAIFGTLQYSGAQQSGYGSVYALKQDLSGTWHKTTLAVFTDQNAAYPTGILAFDSSGNIYGTSEGTSTYGAPGSVYQLVPAPGGTWTYNRLYTFSLSGGDGLSPIGGVIFGLNGALYGTTAAGGATGNGAVFSLTPGSPWTEMILYSFQGKADGSFPIGGLAADSTGKLFGVAEYGGAGFGTAFVLRPPTSTGWTFGLLHEFQGGSDGQQPTGPVLLGKGGTVSGTTIGSSNPAGTVYRLTFQ